MEFLKLVRRRSFLSELVYMILNIGMAIALLAVIWFTSSVPLAIAIVLVSKWRVFAVRVRYWFANFKSNLVDFIVSISVVLHMYTIHMANIEESRKLLILGVFTLLYIAWLLFLKPRSKRSMMAAQAGVSLVLGVSALFTVSYNWPVSIVVVGMWLLGYTAARHVLSTYDEETHGLSLGLAWGLVIAEIGWVAYHWAIAYSMPFVPSILLPQVAIIVTLVSFVAYKAYDSFYHHSKIRTSDIILPLLFSLSVIALLIFVFNRVGTTI